MTSQLISVTLLMAMLCVANVLTSIINNSSVVPECLSSEDCPSEKACVNLSCVNPCEGGCGNNTESLPECLSSEDCPSEKACVNLSCVNPCEGGCGSNTECRVKDHVTACSCSPGHSGHPFSATGCLANTNGRGGIKKFHAEGTFKLNWFEAFIYCQSKNQELATIQSKQENDQMLEDIKQTQGYKDDNSFLFWTAGTDLPNEGVWFWMISGKPIIGFTDWHTGQPDNFEDREHCLAFADRKPNKWHDADCKKIKAYFVCQTYE